MLPDEGDTMSLMEVLMRVGVFFVALGAIWLGVAIWSVTR